MTQLRELQSVKPELQPDKPSGLDINTLADAILDQAREVEIEQATLLDFSLLESQYCAAFTAQVEAKHDQVERIEGKLENLIEQETSRLQQVQSSQPGIFSRPGARTKWQSQVQQQQSTMLRLHGRLEAVREIKESMGINSPRIEELAARKLRVQEPKIAKDWEEMCEAQRQHQALLRKQEQDNKHELERERREIQGRSFRLNLSQVR